MQSTVLTQLQIGGLVFGIVYSTAIIISIASNTLLSKRLKKINAGRKPLSKEEFICFFLQKGYRREHIEAVYDMIRQNIIPKEFSLYPDDDLYGMYEIDPEDLEFDMDTISKELNLFLPAQAEFDRLHDHYKGIVKAEYLLEVLRLGKAK